MNEEGVFFQGDCRLEGMLGWPGDDASDLTASESASTGRAKGGVVVAHPYPPNGANMNLPVIHRIAKSCREGGFASLRFNFRSVGASEGEFSGTEEHRDVLAALSFMRERLDSIDPEHGRDSPLGLAGWSFGSVMAARAASEAPGLKALVLVGLPIRWDHLPADTLDKLGRYHEPVLAVCAENDHHGTPDEVQRALSELELDLRVEVVREADHYLIGRHREVATIVADFFSYTLGRT